MAVLITDGWQNMGESPHVMAGMFPRLHVLALRGGSLKSCQELARAGQGICVPVSEWRDVSGALNRIFC